MLVEPDNGSRSLLLSASEGSWAMGIVLGLFKLPVVLLTSCKIQNFFQISFEHSSSDMPSPHIPAVDAPQHHMLADAPSPEGRS